MLEGWRMESTSTYTLANEQECERLEAQALLDKLDDMLRHLSLPKNAHVLDAGSGSGAYARAIARSDPTLSVIGIDINPSYVAYAARRATHEGLANLAFRPGDLQSLPVEDAVLDAVWTRYVLYFLPEPERALTEFRRVLRPGGRVVIALNDWDRTVFEPLEPDLEAHVKQGLRAIGKTGLAIQLPALLRRLGFVDVKVALSIDPVFTSIGGQSAAQHANLAHIFAAARPYIARSFNDEARADEVIARLLAYVQRPDALMVVPLWHIIGCTPPA